LLLFYVWLHIIGCNVAISHSLLLIFHALLHIADQASIETSTHYDGVPSKGEEDFSGAKRGGSSFPSTGDGGTAAAKRIARKTGTYINLCY